MNERNDFQQERNSMTKEESLRVISDMIEKTRAERTPTFEYDLKYWGIACLLVSILTYVVVKITGNHWWGYLWFLIIPLMSPFIIRYYRRPKGTQTYLDEKVNKIFELMLYMCGIVLVGVLLGSFVEMKLPPIGILLTLNLFVVSSTFIYIWDILSDVKAQKYAGAGNVFSITYLMFMLSEPYHIKSSYHLVYGIFFGVLFLGSGWKYRRRKGVKK